MILPVSKNPHIITAKKFMVRKNWYTDQLEVYAELEIECFPTISTADIGYFASRGLSDRFDALRTRVGGKKGFENRLIRPGFSFLFKLQTLLKFLLNPRYPIYLFQPAAAFFAHLQILAIKCSAKHELTSLREHSSLSLSHK